MNETTATETATRKAFRAASERRRAADAAWEATGKKFAGAEWEEMRAASRAEMDAYSADFDARHAAEAADQAECTEAECNAPKAERTFRVLTTSTPEVAATRRACCKSCKAANARRIVAEGSAHHPMIVRKAQRELARLA